VRPIEHIASDLVTDGFYRLDDPTHSIIGPARQAAYNKSSNPVKAAGRAIVTAADGYRTTGFATSSSMRDGSNRRHGAGQIA
jgi:poly(beta-D-mannuronate) lyase